VNVIAEMTALGTFATCSDRSRTSAYEEGAVMWPTAVLCGPDPDAPIALQGCSVAASRRCHRPNQVIPRRTSQSVLL